MIRDNEHCTLVLGGGGGIGSQLVRSLLFHGRRVRVLELPHRRQFRIIPEHPNLEWLEGDFVNINDVSSALRNVDAVYHLVSTTQPKSSNDNPQYDVHSNLIGTLQLLEGLRTMPEIPLIFISSGGTIYGNPLHSPIPETHATDPICSYGIVKLTIEKYLAYYHREYGLNYRVLRLANPYGPGMEVHKMQGVIGVFMSHILHGQAIDVWGDGSVVRDYVYIGDVCNALVLAESYKGAEHIFNIGSGQGYSLLEIVSAIERVTERKANIRFSAERKFDVQVSVLDIRRAQEELGWHARTSLEDGLIATREWLIG